MATVTATSNGGHTLRNWILAGLGAAAILGLITFGIVYGAEKNSGDSTRTSDTQIGAVAILVGAHATDVREHANRMIEIGQAESNDQWVAQGTSLLAEARRLESVAAQIQSTDHDYRSIFPQGQGVDLYKLRGDGLALQEAGQMLVDHASTFATTADEMIKQAQGLGSPRLTDSARLMQASADQMAADGRSVILAAQPLLTEADQLERSLGH
jgi:hypothetical protein